MDNICCISGCERFGSPIVSRHFKVTGNEKFYCPDHRKGLITSFRDQNAKLRSYFGASIFEETAPKEFVYDEYLPEELDGNLKFKGDE
jgi:hypothetical protein